MEYKGQLKGFPQEVVEWMLDQQEAQGNKRDVSVFEGQNNAYRNIGGFDWPQTEEGFDFCRYVINRKNFDLFFERYPKKPTNKYPMVMWVGNTKEQLDGRGVKRVVFAEKCGKFIGWYRAETIEESESITRTSSWQFAEPFIEEPPLKLTLSQVAEKFGVERVVIEG